MVRLMEWSGGAFFVTMHGGARGPTSRNPFLEALNHFCACHGLVAGENRRLLRHDAELLAEVFHTTPSHLFPCKAFLNATIVLKKEIPY